jgi:hypothetical protein
VRQARLNKEWETRLRQVRWRALCHMLHNAFVVLWQLMLQPDPNTRAVCYCPPPATIPTCNILNLFPTAARYWSLSGLDRREYRASIPGRERQFSCLHCTHTVSAAQPDPFLGIEAVGTCNWPSSPTQSYR